MTKITIVEDETDLGELLVCMINHQYPLVTIEYHKFYDFTPKESEVYILDHDMHFGMNGSQWLKEFDARVPVNHRILMSANPFTWQDKKVSGHFLSKPFRPIELYDAIDNILTRQYKEQN